MIFLSKIGRCLKTLRQMSYKKLENIRKLCECSLLSRRWEQHSVELIYFDEFSVNTKHNSFKGCTTKGSITYIKNHNDSFTMSFIWALSKTKVYSKFGSFETINAKNVQHFIELKITQRNQNLKLYSDHLLTLFLTLFVYPSLYLTEINLFIEIYETKSKIRIEYSYVWSNYDIFSCNHLFSKQ